MNEINTLGMTLPTDEKYSSGIGYIALPSDIARDTYLNDCYQNYRVSIRTSHDGHMNRVQISEEDLNWIEFPADYKLLGSPVYYIVDPINNQPYITKVFKTKNKLGGGKENQFKIGRSLGTAFVEISGNPEKGFLSLTVNNDDNSEIDIVVNNKNGNGQLNLQVNGNMTVNSTGNNSLVQNGIFHSKTFDPANPKTVYSEIIQSSTEISQLSKTSSVTADTTHSITAQEIDLNASVQGNINAPLLSINSGTEPFTLGNKMKAFLNDFIQEVGNVSVVTMLGTSPALNAIQILAYQQRLDEFLSSVGFIDK